MSRHVRQEGRPDGTVEVKIIVKIYFHAGRAHACAPRFSVAHTATAHQSGSSTRGHKKDHQGLYFSKRAAPERCAHRSEVRAELHDHNRRSGNFFTISYRRTCDPSRHRRRDRMHRKVFSAHFFPAPIAIFWRSIGLRRVRPRVVAVALLKCAARRYHAPPSCAPLAGARRTGSAYQT